MLASKGQVYFLPTDILAKEQTDIGYFSRSPYQKLDIPADS